MMMNYTPLRLLAPDDPPAGGSSSSDNGDSGERLKLLNAQDQLKTLQSELSALKEETAQWDKRHRGLQSTYDRERAAREELENKYKELNPNYQSLQKEHANALERLQQLEATHAESGTKLQTAEEVLARYKTVVHRFPDLLPFIGTDEEGNSYDLLPQGQGDELIRNLEQFRKLQPSASAPDTDSKTADKPKQGISPEPPSSDKTQTIDAKRQEAFTALRQGKLAEYRTLMAEVSAALKKP